MRHILLAISGGIDSMYMAYRAPELFPGARFAVAHCNFSLRGEESDGDEAFVRDWCSEREITLHVTRFDTTAYASERHISTEMAARELRYTWFEKLCKEYGYDAVATAHNANDNAETLILNLLRGSGTRGLRGMSSEGRILRPLLGTTREEIREWMDKQSFSWREDSTNAQNNYRRNIIRNEVFPIFKQINPSVVKTLNSDAQRIAMVDNIARDYFNGVKNRVCTEDGSIVIPRLLEISHWEYVLWCLLEDTGIGQSEFGSLVDSLKCGRQTAGRRYGPVTGNGERLRIEKDAPSMRICTEVISIDELEGLRQDEGTIILDADKISEPVRFRKWQAGDWMRPMGMTGRRKKLSDMMTDLKWSVDRKEKAEVIEIDGSHVAALLCCRIDESVKVTDKTRRVLRIRYSII